MTKAPPDWQATIGTTVVFNVKDCHAAWEELKRRGVRCEDPEAFPGYVTLNRLQMCSPLPAGSAAS